MRNARSDFLGDGIRHATGGLGQVQHVADGSLIKAQFAAVLNENKPANMLRFISALIA